MSGGGWRLNLRVNSPFPIAPLREFGSLWAAFKHRLQIGAFEWRLCIKALAAWPAIVAPSFALNTEIAGSLGHGAVERR